MKWVIMPRSLFAQECECSNEVMVAHLQQGKGMERPNKGVAPVSKHAVLPDSSFPMTIKVAKEHENIPLMHHLDLVHKTRLKNLQLHATHFGNRKSCSEEFEVWR